MTQEKTMRRMWEVEVQNHSGGWTKIFIDAEDELEVEEIVRKKLNTSMKSCSELGWHHI